MKSLNGYDRKEWEFCISRWRNKRMNEEKKRQEREFKDNQVKIILHC